MRRLVQNRSGNRKMCIIVKIGLIVKDFLSLLFCLLFGFSFDSPNAVIVKDVASLIHWRLGEAT